jgi:aminoglycoside phosphotransferase
MHRPVEQFLISALPPGTEVLATRSYRPGYREYPMRVSLRTPGGNTASCVLNTAEGIGLLTLEAGVLRCLAEAGLPVPAVLAGPVALDGLEEGDALIVLSELPGEPLPWCGVTSLADADLACRLLIQGVLRIHELTDQVSRQAVAQALPRVTLSSELDEIVRRGGEWLEVGLFAEATDRLRHVIAAVEVPLVLSNGDYNPLNFLHQGGTLTGWVDFREARFEDPHIGFVKFRLWQLDDLGWGTGMKAGLIERYLYAQGVSRSEFAPRLVLRCLSHLQREVTVRGEEDANQRRHMLNVLADGLSAMERRRCCDVHGAV